MRHFALTHSLTLIGAGSAPVRLVLLVRKRAGGTLPCYWLRMDEANFAEAISTGRTILSESFNLIVAIASRDIPDGSIAACAAQALSRTGLDQVHLSKHPRDIGLSGAA